jgi:hypothetical protein
MYIHTFMLTQQRPKDTKDIKRHIQRLQNIGCRARKREVREGREDWRRKREGGINKYY